MVQRIPARGVFITETHSIAAQNSPLRFIWSRLFLSLQRVSARVFNEPIIAYNKLIYMCIFLCVTDMESVNRMFTQIPRARKITD